MEKFLLEIGDFDDLSRARSARSQLEVTSGAVVKVVKLVGADVYQLQVGPMPGGAPIERLKALVATLGLGQVDIRAVE